MGRASKIQLNSHALVHNIRRVRAIAPQSKIIAMIKANAYGHGLTFAAKALAPETDAFGVACIEEALEIRDSGIETQVVLLEGFFQSEELPLIAQKNMSIVLHCHSQLRALLETPLATPIDVWLKLDTGMHRLGFAGDELAEIGQCLMVCPWVSKLRLMTHFAQADELGDTTTQEQITSFEDLSRDYELECSLANSAGILAWPNSHANWVRPGLMLYGISPFADKTGSEFGLMPAMQFDSEIIATHHYPKGAAVGYGGIDVCQRDSVIAVVAVGYGDGYPRHARSGTPVLIGGHVAPLFGRISMDMLTVDVTDIACEVGMPVTLWGEALPVELIAHHADTIPYELCCKITDRVRSV